MNRILIKSWIITAACFYSCTPEQTEQEASDSGIEFLDTPAPNGSLLPNLFVNDRNELLLSWVESNDSISVLKYDKFSAGNWTNTVTIAEGSDWFVNWADYPSIVSNSDNKMAAHFLAKNGPGTFAYGVNMVFTSDGETWSEPRIPHETETETEHGFVSMLPYEDGFFATWLDGRNTVGGHGHGGGPMSIRAAFLDMNGQVISEYLLDEKACDCCQTSAAMTPNGPVVAYRDRTDDEIRDMSIVRWTEDGWTEPVPIFNDGWNIAGCPVNGPSLAAKGDLLAVAWFTGANDSQRVNLSFSSDSGESFSDPVAIDHGSPIGRVDIQILNEKTVAVTWMEQEGKNAKLMLGKYSWDGTMISENVVSDNSSERSSGFPQLAFHDDNLILAWRQKEEDDWTIKLAKVTL